jgi:hypothetical protein
MKEYSQMQKYISALMIFIVLVYLSGCVTTTIVIFPTGLQLPDSHKYPYIVHSEKSKFLLEKATISNDALFGKIEQIYSDNSYDKGNKTHLYFSSDSVIKIDKGEFLRVPIDEVTKVEVQEIQGMSFIGFVSGILLPVVVGIILSRVL